MSKLYRIGLDCGKDTGLAVMSLADRQFLALLTRDFWGAYDYITKAYSPENTEIHLEWLGEKPNVYARQEAKTDAVARRHGFRIAGAVGQVQRETTLMRAGLERLGYDVRLIKPSPKWKQKDFEDVTGKKQPRCSQHARDAAKFCLQYR